MTPHERSILSGSCHLRRSPQSYSCSFLALRSVSILGPLLRECFEGFRSGRLEDLGPQTCSFTGLPRFLSRAVDVNMGTTLTISHVAGIRSKTSLPVWSSRTYRGKNSKHGWITSTLQEALCVNRRDNGPLMNSKIQWFEDSIPPSKWNEICYQWRCLSWKKLGGTSIPPGSMRRDCILWMWLGHVVSLG
jgi:hypothetical protein